MATKKIPGRERQPVAGAAKSLLNTVKLKNSVKSTSKDTKSKEVVDAIVNRINDAAAYNKDISSAAVDATVQEVRALLNQLNSEQIQPTLEEIKDSVSLSVKSVIGDIILNQITNLFDDDAKKDDIEDLKMWMLDTFSKELATNASQMTKEEIEQSLNDVPDFSEEPISNAGPVPEDEEPAEDAKEGDYQDSTPAKNFATLQEFVNTQFDDLNQKLKNIPGQSGILSHISAKIGSGFSKVFSTVGKVTKGIMGGIGSIAKKTLGVFSIVGTVAGGIKKLGSKIGGAIASPFKKIGGFFKSINPFKKSDERAAEKKQSAKDKIFNFMAKILDKIWKLIEPFVEKVAFFMGLITKFVIIPIAIIMAKILLVVGAIIALGVAAYLAYTWVKNKIASFWKYITSGEMWKDLKAKLLEWWEWIKDFGKWLWNIIVKALKYIFCDMWVDLAKWLWEQITKFWNWIYEKFIGPYIVEPIKKVISLIKDVWENKIKPIIQPFIDSLMSLYEKIKTAFSAWDTNKSIWENLKNIGGIIVDSIKEWWETSPFKEFYDKYLDPIVKSLGNLIERIKTIWANFKWDENKSFFENLKCLAAIMIDAIKQWWIDPNNPIKSMYNKYIKPIIDTIKEKLQPFIDKAKEVINSIGNAIWDVPVLPLMRPFGFLVGKPVKLSDAEKNEYENFTKLQNKISKAGEGNAKLDKQIADLEAKLKTASTEKPWYGGKSDKESIEAKLKKLRSERDENQDQINRAKLELQYNEKQKAKQLAQQQVEGAMKPINSINNMNADTNSKLQQEGQTMSQQMQEKEEQQQKYDANQYSMMYQMNENLKALNSTVSENANNPSVVTVPTPVVQSPQQSASMNATHNYIMTY